MSAARLEQLLADAGLAPAEVAELSDLLAPLAEPADHAVGAVRAPEPSAELAALFGESADGDGRPAAARAHAVRRWRVRTASLGAVVLAVSSVGATGLSAAANSLPSVVQHHVSQFSRHYLPFDFPEPEKKTDEPLGQGRFARSPETSLPDQDGTLAGAGTLGIEPPRVLVTAGHPSQAGPFFLAPGPSGQQAVRASGPQGYAVPSASPSPQSSTTPSSGPSATPSQDPGGEEPAGRPASPSASPTSPSATSHPGKGANHGQGGAHKPGRGEDPSTGGRPGKTPGKTPGKPPGQGSGSGPIAGAGTDTGTSGVPGTGQGGGGPAGPVETAPTPAPGIVVPELPGLGELPDLPLAP